MTEKEIFNKLIEYGISEDTARILTATAIGESGLNPEAIGDYGQSIGLFQIHIPSHPDKLVRLTGSKNPAVWKDWLKNPENNIKAAVEVYRSQGLGAWTVYREGIYQKFWDRVKDLTTSGEAGKGGGPALEESGKPKNWLQYFLEKFREALYYRGMVKGIRPEVEQKKQEKLKEYAQKAVVDWKGFLVSQLTRFLILILSGAAILILLILLFKDEFLEGIPYVSKFKKKASQ